MILSTSIEIETIMHFEEQDEKSNFQNHVKLNIKKALTIHEHKLRPLKTSY